MSMIYLIDDSYELDIFYWLVAMILIYLIDCYELDMFDYEQVIFDEIGSSAAASLLYTSILLVITSHSFSLVAFLLSI